MIIKYLSIITIGWMFILNLFWLVSSIKNKEKSDIYMHTGIAVFFGLLGLELTLGNADAWGHLDIEWLHLVGWILYIPAVILVFDTIIEFHKGGKTLAENREKTDKLVESGVFKYVRQPMTLGMAIWSVALLFLSQSIVAVVMSISAVVLFWLSATSEAEYNIRKFGDAYRDYMHRVPMWNIFKGIFRKKDQQRS